MVDVFVEDIRSKMRDGPVLNGLDVRRVVGLRKCFLVASMIVEGMARADTQSPATPPTFNVAQEKGRWPRTSCGLDSKLNDLTQRRPTPTANTGGAGGRSWVANEGIEVVVAAVRYPNSDRPLQTWYPFNDEYLAEQLRREGRGGRTCIHDAQAFAAMILNAFVPIANALVLRSGAALIRRKWTGTHFHRKRTWLRELGLRVQLGHSRAGISGWDQDRGPNAAAASVLVAGDCHRAQYLRNFRVLRLFQIINCLGKLSAYDFLRGLELCTNHDGLDKPPDRRKPFMHIVRQWREVKRMKRAKRGHDPGGVRATKQGELAVMCRACPQPGWNLPDNWEEIDPFYRFIYFLFLAQDANFRLSNRNVSSESADPFWVTASDIFANGKATMATRRTSLSTSTSKRPCSWPTRGGERPAYDGDRRRNVLGTTCGTLMELATFRSRAVLQYGFSAALRAHDVHPAPRGDFVRHRVSVRGELLAADVGFPRAMRLKLGRPMCGGRCPIFTFHLTRSHVTRPIRSTGCGGRHDARGRRRAKLGLFQWSGGVDKANGTGVGQATLEDVFGFHNYDRLLAMHRVLLKRLAVSIKEGTKHKAAFDAFNDGLEALRPEEVKEWRAWVARWEAQQHTTPRTRRLKYQKKLAIATEELLTTDDGVAFEQEHSPGSFISMGLEIEHLQRRLKIDVKALKDPSAAQKLAFTKRRTTMLKRIHKFRQIQRIYMPALRAILSDAQKQVFDGNGEQVPEATCLFMPSEIERKELRGRACAVGLGDVEARMHEGEATDALEALRNYTGQGMMTKGQGILQQINIKIHIAKLRYRYSRAALLVLSGHGHWEEKLKVLNEDDICALNEQALTAEEKAQNEHWAEIGGAIIEGGVARAAGVAAGEGNHTLSWIWYTVKAAKKPGENPEQNPDDAEARLNDPQLNDALRAEWCKATIAFGRTEAANWDQLATEELPNSSPELTEGRRAYAAEHANTERWTCALLEHNWAGILQKADVYLDGRMVLGTDELVRVHLDLGDELEPEEEEVRLEGEEGDD
ncbi:hypothetical protein B0H13DRAFT_1919668 [Mycena leptocephala]|nr:hypothetical protein B0H13DRAFT_1919668 [Mycena leptocephala]